MRGNSNSWSEATIHLTCLLGLCMIMCTVTFQSLGCTVELFIHTWALFWGDALQHKHRNLLRNMSLFAKHMSSPFSVEVWICSGSHCRCMELFFFYFVFNSAGNKHIFFVPFFLIFLYFLMFWQRKWILGWRVNENLKIVENRLN